MFVHGKTNKRYFSVKEKLAYYKARVNDSSLTSEQKSYARQRICELDGIDKWSYQNPRMVVVNDSKFGNPMSKPRLCVAIKSDNKNRILVAPLMRTNTNYIILDNDIERQISKTADGKNKWVSRDEIYEDKYISPHAELTDRDIAKIKRLYK